MDRAALTAAILNCLAETDLPLPGKYRGKVRDTYDLGDGRLVLVTTDRQSGFDRYLGAIPFKGQVLNRASLHWFAATKGIIGNHVLSSPHANALFAKKCRILPIEFVVRGYLTGSTDTSIWTKYAAGAREYCGHKLPDGMKKNERLAANIVTPTTKEATHDRPLSPSEIISEGWLTREEWEFASAKALELFAFGQAKAAERGLILVDTKYEFGVDASGDIILCDEIHTPDSSRWWIAESYAARLSAGQEPEMIDKEFFRLWFRERCDPYKDEVLPPPPDDLLAELAARYVQQFEMMTGESFAPDDRDLSDVVLKAVIPAQAGIRQAGQEHAFRSLPDPRLRGDDGKEVVLIIGSGAREHAIAEALARSAGKPRLVCFGSANNPGIAKLCDGYAIGGMEDAVGIAAFANAERATLAVIGPEAPLAAGVADALWDAGVPAVGPKAELAQVESSKGFTRDLLARHGIPGNPFFKRFSSMDGVEDVLRAYAGRHVIKDDGLAGGKGVKVFGDHLHSHEESVAFCRSLARGFVIEEKIEGQEFSLLSFCDGRTLRHMPAVQDHKRAFDGDEGPNTGGMGTYTDADHKLPFLSDADIAAAREVNERVAAALEKDCGAPYQGILYGGFMATADGVTLIEYNARFGDPESLNLLTLLETDFLQICRAIVSRELDRVDVKFGDEASVCKYIVPEGYPDAPRKGDAIELPHDVPANVRLYLGAVDEQNGCLVATGSRTLGIVGTGATIAEAEAACQRVADQVRGPFFHRRDIGTDALIGERVAHMERLRDHRRVKAAGRAD